MIILTELPNISKGLCAELENYRFKHDQTRREELAAARCVQLSIVLRNFSTIHSHARIYRYVRGCVRALVYTRMYKEDRQHVVRSHELVKRLILTFQHSSCIFRKLISHTLNAHHGETKKKHCVSVLFFQMQNNSTSLNSPQLYTPTNLESIFSRSKSVFYPQRKIPLYGSAQLFYICTQFSYFRICRLPTFLVSHSVINFLRQTFSSC